MNAELSASVIDYPARDMTITVGAGMTFGDMSAILLKENQQLPIDVADDQISIKTMVDQDIAGPRQFGHGTLRDYVIGLTAIDGQGRTFHSGGRVVKNVAGYDLCRLLTGAQGQLGTITEVTFKLRPLPPDTGLVACGFRNLRDMESALDRLNVSSTTPVILDVISRYAAESLLAESIPELVRSSRCADSAGILIAGFEGPKAALEWQTSALQDELHGTADWTHPAKLANASFLYCRTLQKASTPSEATAWQARLTTLPSRVTSSIKVLHDCGCDVFGRAGNGVLYVRPSSHRIVGEPPVEQKGFETLQSLTSDGQGSVQVLKATAARSSLSSAAVQKYTDQLRALLGSAAGQD